MTTRELEAIRRLGVLPNPLDPDTLTLLEKIEGWRREELRQAQAQGFLLGMMAVGGLFAAVVFLHSLGVR